MNNKYKISILSNIPSPYRVPIFNILGERYKNRLLVVFSSKREHNRAWNVLSPTCNHIYLNNKTYKENYHHFSIRNIKILGVFHRFSPDIIVTTGFNFINFLAFVYSKIFKKKYIYMTDGWIISEKDLSVFHRLLRKYVFKKIDAFLGAGTNSVELFKSYKVPANKIYISQLSVNNTSFKNDNGFHKRPYDLLFCGRFSPEKSPLLFAQIAREVLIKYPDLKVLIVGDGPLKKQLLSDLDKYNINYHFTGFVSQSQLPNYYAMSKLLLFPTIKDCWGVVVNEAMASGTPVISSPYTGVVNDLLINELNGFVIDLDKSKWVGKIIYVLNNPQIWEKLSFESKKIVKRYNFENSADGIIKACEYVNKNI